MGGDRMIDRMFQLLFGSGGNVIRDTAEVFRVNAEAEASRRAGLSEAALAQFAQEFARAPATRFDRVIDGVNRLPRPAMAFGTLALLASAMAAPEWFAARMTGLALVPEPLWWLLAAVVSFYFGARHQAKGQDLPRQIIAGMAAASAPPPADKTPETADTDNAALAEWRALRGQGI
ncbi:holin family protein [Salipiger sp. PrR002]|uniref:holin family protein n=1 Tax=Salipiger sp. PrR002 TaxID=2706489 RepID=UPI0019443DDB|nr:holin family protein [Salipiger sp. PrR002]